MQHSLFQPFRETRKLGLATLEKTLQLGTPSQVKELLLQVAEYLEQESSSDKHGVCVNGIHQNRISVGGREKDKGLGSKRKTTQDRVEKGARYISQLLVHCLHKEGICFSLDIDSTT